MRVLLYKNLNTKGVKAAFAKVIASLQADDFRSAEVKKLAPSRYWRAKLDYSNRLLLQFARYGDETVCLVLEVIENHAYEKSRFLRGSAIDEAKIEREPALTETSQAAPDSPALRWLHGTRNEFELLDKPIIFDDAQEAVRRLPPPIVVIGSAGSGKTAVTLARLREMEGRVLYVTLSAYLAQSARSLYAAHGFENPAQEVDFLSYREFMETLRVPPGRELGFSAFASWYERHRQAARASLGELDAHALFEEFRGVIGANPQGPLSLDAYLALGPRQSLLDPTARQAAHALFQRYQQWLQEARLFDLNLVAWQWQKLAQPLYDFVVIDEVQDLTNVQLALVLACLKEPGAFLLCGDSNQIVHPNFFSWAAVRSLFWNGLAGAAAQHQTLSVLQANFRNTRSVTALANTLLKIKQARFGSIDRESNFLVQCASLQEGSVTLLAAKDASLRELDAQTRASVQHAVVVLRDEDKASAREHFKTPLVFSVHEAKGLEYPHVILYSLISQQRAAYAEVCNGVSPADLLADELHYKRAKDKGDKSLELYKFYVNALYVAMTRAVETLTLVESDTGHPLLSLLGLQVHANSAQSGQPVKTSSREEWAQEARKLELQGKEEQAQAIRDAFLQTKPVPWAAWSDTLMQQLLPRALDRSQPSNKPRQALMDYALWHGQQAWIAQLHKTGFAPARNMLLGQLFEAVQPDSKTNYGARMVQDRNQVVSLRRRYMQPYTAHNFKDLLRQCDTYGIDHPTPTGASTLMMAARAGNLPLVDALLQRGSNPQHTDEFGHTAWLMALNRAMEEPSFARTSIGPLFERIGPAVLDVQSDERLIRLERHQGEYWLLSLMLAGLKTLRSTCVSNVDHIHRNGFYAEALQTALENLPEYLWPSRRRKRSYVNGVLARAEANSQYQPARRLWLRISNGHYLPNPQTKLRSSPTQTQDSPESQWTPTLERLNLPWVDAGTDWGVRWMPTLGQLAERAVQRGANQAGAQAEE